MGAGLDTGSGGEAISWALESAAWVVLEKLVLSDHWQLLAVAWRSRAPQRRLTEWCHSREAVPKPVLAGPLPQTRPMTIRRTPQRGLWPVKII